MEIPLQKQIPLTNINMSYKRATPTGFSGFPGSDSKESTCNVGDLGSIPGLGRSPGGGHGNPLQYSCLENPHGQRSLAGYSPQGLKELDMTEWLSTFTHSYIYERGLVIRTWLMWLCKLRSTTICHLQVEDSGKLVEYFENLGAGEPMMMYTMFWLNQSSRERVNSLHLYHFFSPGPQKIGFLPRCGEHFTLLSVLFKY